MNTNRAARVTHLLPIRNNVVPTKTKAARPRKPRPKPQAEPIAEIIVRRGALRRFDALKRKTADLPVVITWDRRLEERREPSTPVDGDRRKTDRRAKPPFTWELSDFVVVAPRGESPQKPKGKKR